MNLTEIVGRDKSHLVQLCLPIEHSRRPIVYPVLASIKLDGVFGIAHIDGDECHIYSRTGEEYLSLEHIKPELKWITELTGRDILIFELYSKDYSQSTISGWCRDTQNQHVEVKAYIHDAMTLEEFKKDRGTIPYHARINPVIDAVGEKVMFGKIQLEHVHIVQQLLVENQEQLQKLADYLIKRGEEGVVARWAKGVYEPGKRNAFMVKVKKGLSFDLKVTGVEEGAGKYKGMVGKLVCVDSTGKEIRVGTGLNDTERRKWWGEGAKNVIGKIAQIDAMAISTKGILREPRFKGLRTDKSSIDVIQ